MSRISVGLSSTLAAAYLRRDTRSPAVEEIRSSVQRAGGDLVPQAPALRPQDLDATSEDPVWFTGDVDDGVADDLARRLLDVEDVQSAFVVAPEGPP